MLASWSFAVSSNMIGIHYKLLQRYALAPDKLINNIVSEIKMIQSIFAVWKFVQLLFSQV